MTLTMTDKAESQTKVIMRPVSELPSRFRPIFPFINFNQVQSLVFETMTESNKPVVVSAPTGSGKTGVFELAIVKVIMDCEQRAGNMGIAKMIYLAPTKALCTERRIDWTKKFGPYNIQCLELTSDASTTISFKDIKKTSILLATPEKWDSITRGWHGSRQFVETIRLLMIDEIHLVNDGPRGAVLEAVISRMKTIRSLVWPEEPDNLRFVGVSATVSNVEDIASWFTTANSIAEAHRVDPKERPVKLRTIVLGYTAAKGFNDFSFDNQLNHKLAEVIKGHSNNKPTLVFCATRKSALTAATTLAKDGKFDVSFASEKKRLYIELANQMKEKSLQEMVRLGIAFHHAGLCMGDRRLIEAGFLDGRIMILCCTSTLALGVNLPAHLVVVKNTSYYDEGQFKPYSESSLVQMIGRAGRPQFDTEATAVIMTKTYCRDEIEKMLTGNLVVDSQLHRYLTEHMNSEIVLGTVTSDAIARKWIESTYLHVRLMKNPENYGLKRNSSKISKETKIVVWCNGSIELLLKHKMIQRTRDGNLEATDIGRAMARHYVCLETMIMLTSLQGDETLWSLLQKICVCSEVINECQIRAEDKAFFNALLNPKDRDYLRFSLGDSIKTREKKAAALVQATFGNMVITENSLLQESIRVNRNATRIANCLRDLAFIMPNISYSLLNNIITLAQCFAAKIWEDSIYVSKQLDRIGPILSQNLAINGLTSFESLRLASPRNIEIFCNRLPPFGSNIQQTCHGLPIYSLKVYFRSIPNVLEKTSLLVEISIENGMDMRLHNSLPADHKVCLIVGSLRNNNILLRRYVSDAGILTRPDLTACFGADIDKINLPEEGTDIEAKVMSEGYVGLDVTKVIKFVQPPDDLY